MDLKDRALLVASSIILVFILSMSVFGENGLMDLRRLQAEHRRLVEENDNLKQENKSLRDEIDRLKNDLEYVGKLARRDLGYVSEDEFIFKAAPKTK